MSEPGRIYEQFELEKTAGLQLGELQPVRGASVPFLLALGHRSRHVLASQSGHVHTDWSMWSFRSRPTLVNGTSWPGNEHREEVCAGVPTLVMRRRHVHVT